MLDKFLDLVIIIVVLIVRQVIVYAFGESITWSKFARYSIANLVVQLVIIFKNGQLTSYVKSYLSWAIFHLNVRFVCMCLFIILFISLCVN